MAWWFLTNNNRTVILAPKCASSSIREAAQRINGHERCIKQVLDQKYIRKQNDVAICLRDPVDRFYSGMSCESTPIAMRKKHKSLDGLLQDLADHEPVHSHFCRQVDYQNYRWELGNGLTHVAIPHTSDSLCFTPAFILRHENLVTDWQKLVGWLQVPHVELKHMKKATQPFERDQGLDNQLRELYAADYELIESLK